MSTIAQYLQQNILFRLYKFYFFDSLVILKRQGWKALMRERGKKVLLIVFSYYLVRDTIVYIIIPYCIARGLF